MYAIIDTGNQQERVEVGTVIEVDYIADAKKGDKVKFDKVLLLSDGKTPHVGQPHVKKAYVSSNYFCHFFQCRLLCMSVCLSYFWL